MGIRRYGAAMVNCFLGIALLLIVALGSCSKDKSGNTVFRYEVSGDLQTPVHIQYTPTLSVEDRDYDWEEYTVDTVLPWNQEVSIPYNASGVSCNVSADEAMPGRSVQIKLYRDSELVAEHSRAVDANGDLYLAIAYGPGDRVTKY